MSIRIVLILALAGVPGYCLRYDPDQVQFNLNQNQTAESPLNYWGERPNHPRTPSPDDWRFPFYSLFLDKFVNGDPENDNANGTVYEQDIMSTQLRHGGDIQGLVDGLDYIQGMGMKGIYIQGSPFINQPWGADSYSPLDLTLLDYHYGDIVAWQRAVDEIHARGMYVIVDHTMSTLGDLLVFEGYLNQSAPFSAKEFPALYKSSRHYDDFSFTNVYNETCGSPLPRFWDETGHQVTPSEFEGVAGCYDSDFDQYGDTEAFGLYPDWRRQLTRFASVQDRLREWHPPVLERIVRFSCMQIAMLDIDGFRVDKAAQVTVDALAQWSAEVRACAQQFGKANFFIPGEITSGNVMGSLYYGRGREPEMIPDDLGVALNLSNGRASDDKYFLRRSGMQGVDGSAFHYSVFRLLTRFLGLSGKLEAGFDLPFNWVDAWNTMLSTNDLLNGNDVGKPSSNTSRLGGPDVRHMYGVSNQDNIRWPALALGVPRLLLGLFVTTLLLPGIPLVYEGDEQALYVLDSTADNYLFGRQPMTGSPAWQAHGCYSIPLSNAHYIDLPLTRAKDGCGDDTVAFDHRDPSHPVRNIIKTLNSLRERYPVLRDGLLLRPLSNLTASRVLAREGSGDDTPTEQGVWSIARSWWAGVPDQDRLAKQSGTVADEIWLVFHNRFPVDDDGKPALTNYVFDCNDDATPGPGGGSTKTTALVAPFVAGTRIRNLVPPFDEVTVGALGGKGAPPRSGCIAALAMMPFEFRAYVASDKWTATPTTVTRFTPGHDARLLADDLPLDGSPDSAALRRLPISISFSSAGDCASVTQALRISSTTEVGVTASVDATSVSCVLLTAADVAAETAEFESGTMANMLVPSVWRWTATLKGVADGVHEIVLTSLPAAGVVGARNITDRFLLRVGAAENPVVWPAAANYSAALLATKPVDATTANTSEGANPQQLVVRHGAPGADKWRYTLKWGLDPAGWSSWQPYGKGGESPLPDNFTAEGGNVPHIIVQYWSRALGTSSMVQHGDLVDSPAVRRRFPSLHALGSHNDWGFDAGLPSAFNLPTLPSSSAAATSTDLPVLQTDHWTFHLRSEPPARLVLNVFGFPSGASSPDATYVLGDIDLDSVLDRLPPSSSAPNYVNLTEPPPFPSLAWHLRFDDGSLRLYVDYVGSAWIQIIVYILLAAGPAIGGLLAVTLFRGLFYRVRVERVGVVDKVRDRYTRAKRKMGRRRRGGVLGQDGEKVGDRDKGKGVFVDVAEVSRSRSSVDYFQSRDHSHTSLALLPPRSAFMTSGLGPNANRERRMVLLATLEYHIVDWNIKIKIGGLGVMAQLMASPAALGHLDLIWVVPCVGGVEYPTDQPAEDIVVTILGNGHTVRTQYHVAGNVTWVLLDAPVFRQQTAKVPYPARMDDLESAVYYAAWNACIAEVARRFNPDIYHINDYHGAAAPLYLLADGGRTIPCCLSLHNAEFQGMWPMRTDAEAKEVCAVFGLDDEVVRRYVRFGSVFNLLHAAVSYLRIHQKGFGAVGVSKKYGDRSYARYPIFWGLSRIGQLPNPDPTDIQPLASTTRDEGTQAQPSSRLQLPSTSRPATAGPSTMHGMRHEPARDADSENEPSPPSTPRHDRSRASSISSLSIDDAALMPGQLSPPPPRRASLPPPRPVALGLSSHPPAVLSFPMPPGASRRISLPATLPPPPPVPRAAPPPAHGPIPTPRPTVSAPTTSRAEALAQTQEWASLTRDPSATLVVFVGRWSSQKGVDLIADLFPTLLPQHPSLQLITVGPLIDLHGRLAALKLARLAQLYPGRVYSRPEFVTLPPFLFSAADFALIPSRDEPFGLVAVESGRQGALGIGAQVGGLGQMPGFWYTVESTTPRHLLRQFRGAVERALASSPEEREAMRARSKEMRFPVSEWVEKLEDLQTEAIRIHLKEMAGPRKLQARRLTRDSDGSSGHPVMTGGADGFGLGLFDGERLAVGQRSPPVATSGRPWLTGLYRVRSRSLDTGLSHPGGPGPGTNPLALNRASAGRPHLYSKSTTRVSLEVPQNRGYNNTSPRRSYDGGAARPSLDVGPRYSYDGVPRRSHDISREQFQQPQNRSQDQWPLGSYLNVPQQGSGDRSGDASPLSSPSRPGSPVSPGGGYFASSPNVGFMSTPDIHGRSPYRHKRNTHSHLSVVSVLEVHQSQNVTATTLPSTPNKELALQKVDPTFTDPNGLVAQDFATQLEGLTAKNSETTLCVEEFLKKAEREWWGRWMDARLGRSRAATDDEDGTRSRSRSRSRPNSRLPPSRADDGRVVLRKRHPDEQDDGVYGGGEGAGSRGAGFGGSGVVDVEAIIGAALTSGPSRSRVPSRSPARSVRFSHDTTYGSHPAMVSSAPPAATRQQDPTRPMQEDGDEFLLGDDYRPPRGLRKLMQRRLFGSTLPFYAIPLCLGQIIATSSHQLVLLTGEVGQTAAKLYLVSGTFLGASILWWLLARRVSAVVVLSLPFALYGLALAILGCSPLLPSSQGSATNDARGRMQDAAGAVYSAAAASGGLFFAMNFGDEGGATMTTFLIRAAVIGGIQQLYITGLWYWGGVVSLATRTNGQVPSLATSSIPLPPSSASSLPVLLVVCLSLAVLLWLIGIALALGLPDYYRRTPDEIPSFYSSLLLRRRLVPWFLAAVAVQNYTLSPLYGRSWLFLFSSVHVPAWVVALLALGFFVGLWALIFVLLVRGLRAAHHPWLVPMLAVGLGAPRWAQTLWATSGIGLWLPWVGGSLVGSALVSRCLWLWLGTLDALQGVGMGIMLLLTLGTRLHVAGALIGAQIVGALFTILGRATAPDAVGPGDVFPDFVTTWGEGGPGAGAARDGLAKPWFWVILVANLAVIAGVARAFRGEQVDKP